VCLRHANGEPVSKQLTQNLAELPGVMVMNTKESFAAPKKTCSRPAFGARARVQSLGARLAAWLQTCADGLAAAAAYEDLSRLSDAELKRRGLNRETLARDLSDGCDQLRVKRAPIPQAPATSLNAISERRPGATRRMLQTGGILLVLLAVFTVLLHAVAPAFMQPANTGPPRSSSDIRAF
jgi:hypothetical protein